MSQRSYLLEAILVVILMGGTVLGCGKATPPTVPTQGLVKSFPGGPDVEVLFRAARSITDPVAHFTGFKPGQTLLPRGTVIRKGAMPLPCDIVFDRDVAVTLRDGTVIYTDVFRPAQAQGPLPAIVAWSPYGKGIMGGNQHLDEFPGRVGVPRNAVSDLQKWEGPDPAYWCLNGYAIVHPDARGVLKSQGDVAFWGTQEGRDGADLVEWVAAQPWSNGKVGLAGNSWLAIAQWFIAAERPPHLAAIAPWEGHVDGYRCDVLRGGIPDIGFNDSITAITCGEHRVEDMPAMVRAHPMMNAYWEDKRARLERIDIPAYVVASWSNPVHTPGTFEGYERITSRKKWLRVHNTMEWHDFYLPEHQDDLRRFFDCYLKGKDNGWEQTPPVRLAVFDGKGEDRDSVDRPEQAFPLPQTRYQALYLDSQGTLGTATGPEASLRYRGDDGKGKAVFTMRFGQDTELTGFMKLKLWVEAEGSNDMDLFVKVEKLDARGRVMPKANIPMEGFKKSLTRWLFRRGVEKVAMAYYSGPKGRLRVSHRALDPLRSTPEQPYLTHAGLEPLAPGQVVPVEIALSPVSWVWRKGEQLRLTVAGYNLNPIPLPGIPPIEMKNRGTHILRVGGPFDAHLLVPVIPQK
ncbi:MAG: acylase and diesterase protein [Holophagaceae bacterium]|nr:acylase and diesterase protein [Holophagaceae bacterium]